MATTTKFPLGLYVGGPNGSDAGASASFDAAYAGFVQAMGTKALFMDAYLDQTQPVANWASNASWTAWSWAQDANTKGMIPVIGMPLTSTAMGLSDDQFYQNFASGQYDGVIRATVKAWADQGFKTQYWRPGWEFNVSSMPSPIGTDAQTQSDWVKAFQHIYGVLHSAAAQQGVTMQVAWNPNVQNWNTPNPLTVYPGNQYVDVIAGDIYDNVYLYSLSNLGKGDGSTAANFAAWAADPANLQYYYTYPAGTQWSTDGSAGHSMSLQNLIDFAKQQGKPIAIAETGAGGSGEAGLSDNAAFPQWLAATLAASGVEVKFVNIWDANLNGNWNYSAAGAQKPAEAAAWAKSFGAGSAAPVPAAPVVPPAPASPAAAVTIGSGASTLALSVSEDAWQGDAQFTVGVDGRQVGGVQTATAAHGAGAAQTFNVLGTFGPGTHTASVNFLNDAYGGTASTDRNLFVTGATIDGTAVAGSSLTLLSGGPQSFAFNGPASAGADTLDLHVSEDAWQGDAQFTVTVDGAAVGGVRTATALHSTGATQDVSIAGTWGRGAHAVGIAFINDAWGGTSATDRNLYIDQVAYNGVAAKGAPIELQSNGTATFGIPAAGAALTLHLAEDAWQGDAQYAVAVDGKTLVQAASATASHAQGQSQAVTLAAVLAAGPHDLAISFLNDAYAGTAATDRNLYVQGIDVGGTPVAGAMAALMSAGTAHFQIVVPPSL